MEATMKRCGHPDHVGKRYLTIDNFHKQGRKGGRQRYKGICKVCANKQYRKDYHEGRRNDWKHKQAYIRARSRAMTRLSKLVPELYDMCLREELAKEPEFKDK